MDNKSNKMLIDATHPEETRVVVLRNGRVEEFDFESASRKLLRGNIYLAKVTRVEPSLQAAFVDYGGNRHGFLAFNEIHPDYYQIPMADRQALLDEEAAAEAAADAEADARAESRQSRHSHNADRDQDRQAEDHGHDDDRERDDRSDTDGDRNSERDQDRHEALSSGSTDGSHEASRSDQGESDAPHEERLQTGSDPAVAESSGHGAEPSITEEAHHNGHADAQAPNDNVLDNARGDGDRDDYIPNGNGNGDAEGHIEEVAEPVEAPEVVATGTDDASDSDAMEELPERPRRQRRRQYKIQEVIKRRQILLVQVVKEERGNKGAALTTYLSLAGRYTVLMPNTGRGGGISRKITQAQDRKRLKAIAQELDVPEGMGLIIRTAGASRTKQEIRRDYEYLLRLWESVRDLTLESTAPSLVYEEGNLIKRSIRDQYTRDVDEVIVAGREAHREAQDFMRMLMPSHAKNVILHDRPEPLFSRYPVVERQLNAMFSPYVTLKSGGYLVINQTEALVAIDINSGKSTREFSIEETALNTNLEASDEIARQLKLRDLAGLIVIDFIDMEEKRNNRAVERRLKDALRHDRARIQVGRISHFGLMEMSRQRMRTGVLEGSTSQCPHCQGTGIIRSVESVALAVLRGLEDHLQKDSRSSVNVVSNAEVALYILNHKRDFIIEIERRYGIAIAVLASDRMQGSNFAIERSAAPLPPKRHQERAAVNMNWGFSGNEGEAVDEAVEDTDDDPRPASVADARGEDNQIDEIDDQDDDDGEEQGARGDRDRDEQRGGGRRRRRRRRGRGRDDERGGNGDRGDRNGHHRGDRDRGDSGRSENRAGAPDEQQPYIDDPHAAHEAGDNSDYAEGPEGEDDGRDEANGKAHGETGENGNGEARRRRRRGRRGGRRGRERDDRPFEGQSEGGPQPDDMAAYTNDSDNGPRRGDIAAEAAEQPNGHDHLPADGDERSRQAIEPAVGGSETIQRPEPVAAREEPRHEEAAAPTAVSAPPEPVIASEPAQPKPMIIESSVPEAARPSRRGWWQRKVLGE